VKRKKWKEHWILDAKGRPKQVDLLTWAKWFGQHENRVVRQETIAQNRVSTIFLGIDHGWVVDGPPILWETMTFGAKLDNWQMRCAGSKEQAEAMHEKMVRKVCKASGVKYDPHRERTNDAGVWRRQAAVVRKKMREANKIFEKLLRGDEKSPPARKRTDGLR